MAYKIINYVLIILVITLIIYFSVFIAIGPQKPGLTEIFFIDDSSFGVRGPGPHAYEVTLDGVMIAKGTVYGDVDVPIEAQKGLLEVRVGKLTIHYER